MRGMACLLVCLVSWSWPVLAAEDRWSETGIGGGRILGLAVDPSATGRALVATQGGGVFRTDTSGESWRHVSDGLAPGSLVESLAVSAGPPVSFYCIAWAPGLTSSRVYVSRNAGELWEPLTALDGLTINSPARVAADAQAGQKMLFGGVSLALRLSTDGGATSSPVGPAGAQVMAFAPSDSSHALVGLATGLLRSVNGGATWDAPVTGLPAASVSVLKHDPSTPGLVYLIAGSSLYRSLDFGASWARHGAGITGSLRGLALDLQNPQRLVASASTSQLFTSTDGGASWNVVSASFPIAAIGNLLELLPGSSDLLMAVGNSRGILRSSDLGSNWTLANQGLTAARMEVVAFDPIDSNRAYAGSEHAGFFRSLDGGRTWSAPNFPTGFGAFREIAIEPLAPNRIWAATFFGLFLSQDFGVTWETMPRVSGTTWSVAVSSDAPAQVLVGTDRQGIFHSADGGTTFTQVGAAYTAFTVEAVAYDPLVPGRAFAGLATSGGVLRSLDGGLTWQTAASGLPLSITRALAIHPVVEDYLVVAGNLSAAESVDGATSWAATGFAPPSGVPLGVALHPQLPGAIFVGINSGGGVWARPTASSDWQSYNEGLSNFWVTSIAVDPQRPWRQLVATLGQGVFERTQVSLFSDGFESGDTSAWTLVVTP